MTGGEGKKPTLLGFRESMESRQWHDTYPPTTDNDAIRRLITDVYAQCQPQMMSASTPDAIPTSPGNSDAICRPHHVWPRINQRSEA